MSSKPGKTPSTNALRGRIGNDLAVASAKKRGERIVASEVNIRKPGTKLKGSSNIDQVVKGTDTRYHGVEVKSGDGKLRKAQEEHYPKVPKGGLEVGSDSLRGEGMPKGHVLRAGDITSMRVERWDIDSLPADTKTALENHTVADILDGAAGPARQQELDQWMSSPGSRTVDKLWT
ncbi:hypothetical protein GCM10010191_67530 [Actinomadura vinacea]|uniref:Uncharacterized protein n=1 Tax=Actinomadura vinacea TaxID=115336 RepID=A0ABP5X191_9ACTN